MQSQVFELKQRSRWFNGVSGYITKKDFNIFLNFPFVNQADIVCQFKTSPEINEPYQNSNKYSPGSQLNKVYSLDYGPSLTQNQQINVPALHDLGYNGQGVTICVMDAGVSIWKNQTGCHGNGFKRLSCNPSTTNTYVTGSGTSFSCPLTAGVCALLLSYNPGLTPMQVRDALRNTASQNTSPDHHMGWGIINALGRLPGIPITFNTYPYGVN